MNTSVLVQTELHDSDREMARDIRIPGLPTSVPIDFQAQRSARGVNPSRYRDNPKMLLARSGSRIHRRGSQLGSGERIRG